MRVLVATKETQGSGRHDYALTVEGELVIADVTQCASPDHCGCGRGFPGLASRKATTTAMIADLAHLTEADLRQAIADWLDGSGWTDLFGSESNVGDTFDGEFDDVDGLIESMVDEHIELIADICEAFPVGTVVERSGTLVRARSIPFAA